MQELPRFAAIFCCAAFVLAPLAALGDAPTVQGESSASYQVVFVPTWNPATHPEDYPIAHAKKGLLTPMIGATHGAGFVLFAEGKKPSLGLERLSEMGAHDPLDAEIRDAVAAGRAGSLIELSEGSEGPVHLPVVHRFEVDARHPNVSFVGMIAPSPDWFYGVSGVSLRENGRFLPLVVVTAYAWDGGGDRGTAYMADDMDAEPKDSTRPLDHPSFVVDGKPVPVGTFVFKRVSGM